MSERKRVSKEDVRDNAKSSGGGGGFQLDIPAGHEQWNGPEKPGTVEMDILPYEIKVDHHPDKHEKGTIWYKFPFKVHHKIGVRKESLICPEVIGKPCPICQKKDLLAEDWDKNEAAIKLLNAQAFVAFNMRSLKDKTKVDVFVMSSGKFWDFKGGGLKKELEEGADSILNFYDVNKDGRTLQVRFSEETWEKNKFLRATRFDFVKRPEMDEDETLAKTVCLDHICDKYILPYEKIKALFYETAGEAAPAADSAEPRKRGESGTAKEEPKDSEFEVGNRVSFEEGKKTIIGEIKAIDGDDVEIEGEDGKEYNTDIDFLKPAPAKSEAKSAEKTSKAATAESKSETAASTEGKIEEGDTVKDDDGVEGVVLKIKGDDVTYESNGQKFVEDIEDLTLVKKKAGSAKVETKALPTDKTSTDSGKPQKGDRVKITIDGNILEGKIININDVDDVTVRTKDGVKHVVDIDEVSPISGESGGNTKVEEEKPLAVGDKVTWDDGTEKGEIVKIKGDKVKVKDEDGDIVTVELKDLKRA